MPTDNRFDIIVVGAGMAGCAAAIAAARSGCSTLLVERFGFPGGCATAGLVNPFMTHCSGDGTPLVAGLFAEIRSRVADMGGMLVNSFDSECMKFALQEMVLESGATLRLHTCFDAARRGGDGLFTTDMRSKSGIESFQCRGLIDCSGDGDVAVSLGADFEMGDANGLPQAVTLMFDVGGVDLPGALKYVRDHPDQMLFPKLPPDADLDELAGGIISVAGYYDLVARARAQAEFAAPGDMIFYIGRPRQGEVVFNTTHVGGVEGISAADLTRAEIESRRQMMSVVSFARKFVPGFENSYLLRSAAQVGVRETRRIKGDYVFSADDVVNARKFDDAICPARLPCRRALRFR